MGLIVQKYGGSSLADKERILNVARRIVETKRDGNKVIAIVSAMGKTTDKLIQMAREISEVPPKREMDRLLSTGHGRKGNLPIRPPGRYYDRCLP